MRRRAFLHGLLSVIGLGVTPATAARPPALRIQDSPLAGFAYYDGERVWPLLAVGDALSLRREADNHYDHRAVAVWWHEHKLGYLPRIENHAVAQMLDRGVPLQAHIDTLAVDTNPWHRLRLSVHLDGGSREWA